MPRAHGGATGWRTKAVGVEGKKGAGAPGGRPASSPEEEVQDTYAVPRRGDPCTEGSSRGGAAVGPGPHQRPLQKDLAQLGRIHPRPGDNLRRRIGREQPEIPMACSASSVSSAVLKKQGATMAPSASSIQTAPASCRQTRTVMPSLLCSCGDGACVLTALAPPASTPVSWDAPCGHPLARRPATPFAS
jgi:hypothetical protein